MAGPTIFKKGKLEENRYNGKLIGDPLDVLNNHRPIDYIMDWFAKRLPQSQGGNPAIPAKSPADRIMVLRSSTGSGKSTVIPPEFFHRFFSLNNKMICCTQPRVLTTKEIAEGILKYHTKEALIANKQATRKPLVLGDNIGYQTQPISKRPVRGIIYMTIGVLTQQLNIMSDEDFMKKYSIIIIDEVHERSIETDITLYMMKRFIQRHYKDKECPFLLTMSATFDPYKFCDYLLDSVSANERYKSIIQVSGFTHPIEDHFLPYDSPNFIQTTVDKVIELHKKGKKDYTPDTKKTLKEDAAASTRFRDILIFVAGTGEIRRLKKKLSDLNSKHPDFQDAPILPLELTGDIVKSQNVEYKNLFKNIEDTTVDVIRDGRITIKKPVRRVIISTNVGETGVTIETLRYVIDTGFHKSSEFNPSFAAKLLVTKPVTQSMHQQRRGRVGRVAPGECHSIFTKEIFDGMQKDQYPNIVKDDVSMNLLSLLIKEFDPEGESNEKTLVEYFSTKEFAKKRTNTKIDIFKLDLLDLPPADMLHYCIEKLFTLGAIDSNSVPTEIGFIMSKFRFVSIESIRAILAGYAWGAPIIDLITIAAFLQFRSDDILPAELNGNFNKALDAGTFSLFPKISMPGHAHLKTDLMLSGEFMRYITVFYYFQKKLQELAAGKVIPEFFDEDEEEIVHAFQEDEKIGGAKSARPEKNADPLAQWCESVGLSLVAMIDVIKLRDEIIEMMAYLGLDPYHNFSKSIYCVLPSGTDEEKYEYIKTMKQCLFEGYKLNIAVWNPVDKKFYTRKSHLPLQEKLDPGIKYIIYDEVSYRPDPKSSLYTPVVNNLSVLDGYITFDSNFDIIVSSE
jgi:hypothetical protein